ncbi:glycerol-3-phosphate phosphatase-like [Calliphora vicina]|uniref:glycerol-3-phosphate phosphatase-like n=1 Tax=Calliphora vicina TaxID=7373 RepID=UPI00325AC679
MYNSLRVKVRKVRRKSFANIKKILKDYLVNSMINPINIKNLEKKAFKEWLDSFDTILTDCDAVLWHDDNVIPQVPDTINRLKSLDKNIYFVTNNGTKTRHYLWLKAAKMNFHIDENHIIAPTFSIAEYLQQNLPAGERVYVIGSPALAQELNNLNIKNMGMGEDLVQGVWVDMLKDVKRETNSEKVGALVVGFDEHFSFVKMLKASNIMGTNPDCLFLATNADAVHRYPGFAMPGTGAIVKTLETCLGCEAMMMGKPNPLICENLIKSGAVDPTRTLMIGDSAKIDVLFGKNCGFQTLLVGTGNDKWCKVQELVKNNEEEFIPNYYLDSLGDLLTFLG